MAEFASLVTVEFYCGSRYKVSGFSLGAEPIHKIKGVGPFGVNRYTFFSTTGICI